MVLASRASRLISRAVRRASTRAAVCEEIGKGVVARDDWSIPADPPPGSVLVRVRAAGVNFAEALQTRGEYQEALDPPFVPGNECAGIVTAVGDGVAHVGVGDPVIGLPRGGAWARDVVVPAAATVPLDLGRPLEAEDWRAAAGLAVVYGTADLALARRAVAQPGETVLVTAAAGGVGLAAVELAAARGCRVIAAAGDEEKRELALKKGAAAAVAYDPYDVQVGGGPYDPKAFRAAIKEAAPEGVDVAIDMVGGPLLEPIVRSMAFDGRCIVVGFASGQIPKIPANLLLVKNCSLTGLYWGAHATKKPEVFRDSLKRVVSAWRDGAANPHVGAVFPLGRANDAIKLLMGRRSTGKIVLEIED